MVIASATEEVKAGMVSQASGRTSLETWAKRVDEALRAYDRDFERAIEQMTQLKPTDRTVEALEDAARGLEILAFEFGEAYALAALDEIPALFAGEPAVTEHQSELLTSIYMASRERRSRSMAQAA